MTSTLKEHNLYRHPTHCVQHLPLVNMCKLQLQAYQYTINKYKPEFFFNPFNANFFILAIHMIWLRFTGREGLLMSYPLQQPVQCLAWA